MGVGSDRTSRFAKPSARISQIARLPDQLRQEFRSNLANFPRLQNSEAAGCKGLVTESEVRDALKHVGLNKSSGLDGLPNEVYSRLSHMFVSILMNFFQPLVYPGKHPW